MTQGELVYIIYTLGGYCGHQVIDRILFDKNEAIQYQHNKNIEWAKYMSYFDGSTRLYHITAKHIDKNVEFNFDCDLCGLSYSCECFPNKQYKTQKAYNEYWRGERKEHNQKHSRESPDSTCKFCEDDKKLWWIKALQNE